MILSNGKQTHTNTLRQIVQLICLNQIGAERSQGPSTVSRTSTTTKPSRPETGSTLIFPTFSISRRTAFFSQPLPYHVIITSHLGCIYPSPSHHTTPQHTIPYRKRNDHTRSRVRIRERKKIGFWELGFSTCIFGRWKSSGTTKHMFIVL